MFMIEIAGVKVSNTANVNDWLISSIYHTYVVRPSYIGIGSEYI